MFVLVHLSSGQFFSLLDLETKGAQRHQNLNSSLVENPNISLKPLANLLKDEIREVDVVGQGKTNRLPVMLPYADMARVHHARERVVRIL